MRRIKFKPSLRETRLAAAHLFAHLAGGAPPEKREAAEKFAAEAMASVGPAPKRRVPRGGVDIDSIHGSKRRGRTAVDGPSEHQIQAAVIKWWWLVHKSYNLPHFALFAIPNGGARDAITGSLLKAEGVRPGVYDLMLAKKRTWRPHPTKCTPARDSCGLFIEMKIKPNKPSEAQVEFSEYLDSAGYNNCVCYSAEEAINAIREYLS